MSLGIKVRIPMQRKILSSDRGPDWGAEANQGQRGVRTKRGRKTTVVSRLQSPEQVASRQAIRRMAERGVGIPGSKG